MISKNKAAQIPDAMERVIAQALEAAGESYLHSVQTGHRIISFYLPSRDVYIEIKRQQSDRLEEKMSLCENIIAVQGKDSVHCLATFIRALAYSTPQDTENSYGLS